MGMPDHRAVASRHYCKHCGIVSEEAYLGDAFDSYSDEHNAKCVPWQKEHARKRALIAAEIRTEMEAETAALVEVLANRMNEMQAEIDRLKAERGDARHFLRERRKALDKEDEVLEGLAVLICNTVWPNKCWTELHNKTKQNFLRAARLVAGDVLSDAIVTAGATNKEAQ